MPGFSADFARSLARAGGPVERPERPGPADVARHLGVVVHDLRGPATALQAFTKFLDEQARPSLDPLAAAWLDACQANAELASHYCDALSLLEGRCLRTLAPMGVAIRSATARLQKILARARLSLKVPGEFPDREFEHRRLGFVVEGILVARAQAGASGEPTEVLLAMSETGDRVSLTLTGDAELGACTAAALRGTAPGLSALALRAAVADLDALVVARGSAVRVTLPIDGGGADA